MKASEAQHRGKGGGAATPWLPKRVLRPRSEYLEYCAPATGSTPLYEGVFHAERLCFAFTLTIFHLDSPSPHRTCTHFNLHTPNI